MRNKAMKLMMWGTAMLFGLAGGISVQAEEEPYTVRVWAYGDASSDDLAEVSEAISAITREK